MRQKRKFAAATMNGRFGADFVEEVVVAASLRF
jgi:hypothetical protein